MFNTALDTESGSDLPRGKSSKRTEPPLRPSCSSSQAQLKLPQVLGKQQRPQGDGLQMESPGRSQMMSSSFCIQGTPLCFFTCRPF